MCSLLCGNEQLFLTQTSFNVDTHAEQEHGGTTNDHQYYQRLQYTARSIQMDRFSDLQEGVPYN